MQKQLADSPIVIFGASTGAVKVANILSGLGIEFEFFVDNNPDKWNTLIEYKLVKSPEELLLHSYRILIGSNFQTEIEEQLEQMGLKDHIIIKDECIKDYMLSHLEEFSFLANREIFNPERTFIFDLTEDVDTYTGVESWTYLLAKQLEKRAIKMQVIYSQKRIDSEIIKDLDNTCVDTIRLNHKEYLQYMKQLTERIVSHLPCTVIDNWQNHMLMAVAIIKQFYPEQIKCISVLHNDKIISYRKTLYMQSYISACAGVSQDIILRAEREFKIDKQKLNYKDSPVYFESEFIKKYNSNNVSPLKIGYAGRIVKLQKRADLLIRFIEYLVEQKANFQLFIAGDGDYLNKIQEIIEAKGYQEKVTLCGFVKNKEMPEFWKGMDVYINTSDYEGTCLSMLEAMSYGVVPVVTKVSGVDNFVKNGQNGYVVDKGDIQILASRVVELDHNRSVLEDLGERSRNMIHEKCSIEKYTDYIINL